MPRIKISGITNTEDAKWAAILGVEFISVSLEESSEKKISLNCGKEIKNNLPSYTAFVVEVGDVNQMNLKDIKKLNAAYIQFKNTLNIADEVEQEELNQYDELRDIIKDVDAQIIMEIKPGTRKIGIEGLNINLIQLNLTDVLDEIKLERLKKKFNMENTIIHADWELPDIKNGCKILQPYAWSIKKVIEKSPRRIDYNKMKEYIREISLL